MPSLSQSSAVPVGIVGAGEVGSRIVTALRREGRPVVVYDTNLTASARHSATGAIVASDPRELLVCDVVIVSVATAEQTHASVASLSPGRPLTIVIHGTVGPDCVHELRSDLPRAVELIDAPISFRHRGPDEKPMVAYIGADAELAPSRYEILASYCQEVIRVGGLGTGQVVKIANNVMSLVNTAAAAEALRLAAEWGVSAETMRALALASSGASNALETWDVRHGLFDPESSDPRRRELARKDLHTALALAEAAGIELPVTSAAVRSLDGLVTRQGGPPTTDRDQPNEEIGDAHQAGVTPNA